MDNIFISYSRSDKKIVDRLIRQLEAAGHSVWVDREDIRGGHLWHEEIVQALETCPVFILVLSPNSVASDNVRREVDLALENNMLILPLMIEPTKLSDAIKYQLAGLQYIDLSSDYQAGFESLISSLNANKITPQSAAYPLRTQPHLSGSFLQRYRYMLFGGGVFILVILAALIFGPRVIPPDNPTTPAVDLTAVPEQSCLKLSFVGDVGVPDGSIMRPGQRFTKIWRLQNMGTCAWDENYEMVFTGGYRLSESDNVRMPAEVRPGQAVEIAVHMIAPDSPGTFRSEWMLRGPGGETVGANASQSFWAQIVVKMPDPSLTATAPTSTPGPTITPTPTNSTHTPTITPTPTNTPTSTITPTPTPYMRTNTSVSATFLSTPPTLDGNLADWSLKPALVNNVVSGKDNWSNAADLSGSVMLGWDANYLYLGVNVLDDKYVANARGESLFKSDSLEILLDQDLGGDFSDGSLSPDDYQLGILPGTPSPGQNPQAYLWFPTPQKGKRDSVKIAAISTADGYQVEAAVPWSIFDISPQDGQHYGFVFSISDNDDPSKNKQESMVSNVSTRALLYPTTWGNLTLVKP